MAWLKIEPFTGEVFTLAEIKNFARIDTNEDDVLLRALEGAAVNAFERFTGRLLTTRQVEGSIFVDNYARLPVADVAEMQELTSGFQHNAGSVYGLGTCEFKYTASGVGMVEEDSEGANIVAVPEDVRLGLLKWITTNYEDRQNTTDSNVLEMPNSSKILWKPYRAIVA